MAFRKIKNCLACNSKKIKQVLNLNKQPLANSYIKHKSSKEKKYELKVNCCLNCTHLQLSIAVDPKQIYENYSYVSGTTSTYRNYMRKFCEMCIENSILIDKNILDIGCNDGSQLDVFKSKKFKTYGVDPAKNIFKHSSKNHKVFCNFFDDKLIKKLKHKFDIIIAQNSFAHNPDPYNFLINVKKLMHKDSTIFIQTSQADMCKNNEFDTIYHEHVNYFNVNSMKVLSDRAGLKLHKVIKNSIHGTSYIFVITHSSNQKKLKTILQREKYYNYKFYINWGKICKKNVNLIKNKVNNIYKKRMIIGYGAAAKANTFLNFSKIKLNLIVDDNKMKQNKFTPGSHILIKNSTVLKKIKQKLYIIPLAWNFYSEIKKRVKILRPKQEDKFIICFPKFKIQK